MKLIDDFFTKNSLFWGTLRLIIPLLVILFYVYFLYNFFYKAPAFIYRATKDKGRGQQHGVNKIL